MGKTEKEIIEMAKEYNGLIETIDELFLHMDRLQECSNCGKDYYDKLCPTCARKLNSQKDGKGNKDE
jgi:predicted amidophosphoribosyltransferase